VIWLAHSRAANGVAFRIGRDEGRLIAEWPGVARFSADRSGTRAGFDREPDGDEPTSEKIRLIARALTRHLRDELTLHAASVADDRSAIAFVGDSGAGKSTLAAALSRQGYGLLSDDLLFVDGLQAISTETASSLHASARRAMPNAAQKLSSACRLRAIVHLAYGEQWTLSTLKGTRAVAVLMQAMVRFLLDDDQILRRDLDRVDSLMREVSVMELCRPYGLHHLPAASKVIEEWAHK